jgi:hypothetical protein
MLRCCQTEAECDIPNNIEDVCKMIDSTISAAVQVGCHPPAARHRPLRSCAIAA